MYTYNKNFFKKTVSVVKHLFVVVVHGRLVRNFCLGKNIVIDRHFYNLN